MSMILEASKISKIFTAPKPLKILDHVSLKVAKGESVAIMGRSGEGKSTLLNILGTLDSPTSGSLRILQEEVNYGNRNQLRLKHLGFIFQSFHLLEDFTVIDNILMPAKIARQSCKKGSPAWERAEKILEQIGLSERKNHLAKLLSGGEKQRVAIGRSLCNDPDLFFADEPTGNLDRKTAEEIHRLLLDLSEKQGKTLIIVTHNEELANLCQRRLHLKEGVLSETALTDCHK